MSIRKENKKKKETAILESALTVFAKKGYAAAKISNIANMAGVGKGTIYEYHQSKEELFFSVFEWYVDSMAGRSMVEVSRLGGDPSDRLLAFMESVFNSAYTQIDSFSVFIEFWSAAGNPPTRDRYRSTLLEMYGTFSNIIIRLIDEGKQTGVFRGDVDADSVAAGLVSTMDGMMLHGWMDREFDVCIASKKFFTVLVEGMRSPKG